MTSTKKLSFEEKFLRWRKKEGLVGPEALNRYAFFSFLEAIAKVSDDFVLKGGNLLWIYTRTPRETVDLDFSTLSLNSHADVRSVIEKSLIALEDIIFSIESFREMNHENIFGARYAISFKTTSGATNKFQVDIIYKLATDFKKIKTPLLNSEFKGASIENVICDKLNSVLTKIEYSTRVKDYDDLWRISKSGIEINKSTLKALLKKNNLNDVHINYEKVGERTHKGWNKHQKRYKDLPSLEIIVSDINNWILEMLGT